MGNGAQFRPKYPEGSSSILERGSRLDSWKEIAAYLGRSEKTARRWEDREQLPVHRLLHEKRGSVYAYTGELDRWWAARKFTVNSGCAPNEGEPQDLDLAEQSAEGNGIASPGSTTVGPSGLSAEITDSPAPATTDEHQRIGS